MKIIKKTNYKFNSIKFHLHELSSFYPKRIVSYSLIQNSFKLQSWEASKGEAFSQAKGSPLHLPHDEQTT